MSEGRKVGQNRSNDLARAEKLAAIIVGQIEGVLCVKLKQLQAEIDELRGYFKRLKGKKRIEGCRTWEQFCSEKLGRTASAVRKMLTVPKSEAGKLPADSVAAGDTYEAEEAAKQDAAPKERSSSEQEALLLTNLRNEAVAVTTRFLRQVNGQSFANEWRAFQLEVLNDLSDKLEAAKVTIDELVRMPPEFEETEPLELRSAH